MSSVWGNSPFGPQSIDPEELFQIADAAPKAGLPRIKRARGYRLYGLDGKRYLDMYQDGGRALLGHRPEGWTRILKSTGSKGLFAPYPSSYTERARKSLLSLFPKVYDVTLYPDRYSLLSALYLLETQSIKSSLREAQYRAVEDSISIWRPFALSSHKEHELFSGKWGRFCIPLLPIPGDFSPWVLLDVTGEGAPLANHQLSPIVEDLVVKAVSGLKRYLSSTEKEMWERFDVSGVERRGPYLRFTESLFGEEGYGAFFNKMLQEGILLPPERTQPAIIPAQFDEGEVKPLLREVRRRYADR